MGKVHYLRDENMLSFGQSEIVGTWGLQSDSMSFTSIEDVLTAVALRLLQIIAEGGAMPAVAGCPESATVSAM